MSTQRLDSTLPVKLEQAVVTVLIIVLGPAWVPRASMGVCGSACDGFTVCQCVRVQAGARHSGDISIGDECSFITVFAPTPKAPRESYAACAAAYRQKTDAEPVEQSIESWPGLFVGQ